MVNHYEILGLSTGAGIVEIKAAFRQLAKQFHPDLNPHGKEEFNKILKAYEVLSDPNLKYSYDYKLNAYLKNGSYTEPQKIKSKNWKFDERELKRRQYYNEHIKKYEKRYTSGPPDPEPKATYNEFKYILFATPLAVALFLGIMSLASGNRKTEKEPGLAELKKYEQKSSDLKMGDTPYSSYFGLPLYDTVAKKNMTIKNMSGQQMIVCLFRDNRFVRSFFVENNYSAEVSQLPDEPLTIRYGTGSNFDEDLKFKGLAVSGGFREEQRFFKSSQTLELQSINELTLMPGLNDGFRSVDEQEFFRR